MAYGYTIHKNLHSTLVLLKVPFFFKTLHLARYLHSTLVLLKVCEPLCEPVDKIYLHSTLVLLKAKKHMSLYATPISFTFYFSSIKRVIQRINRKMKSTFTFYFSSIKRGILQGMWD